MCRLQNISYLLKISIKKLLVIIDDIELEINFSDDEYFKLCEIYEALID